MKAILLALSYLFLSGDAVAPPLPFDSCTASSVNTDGETPTSFAPANALTPGLDYWCSQPGLDDTEEVLWKGVFKRVTELKGLEVTWAMAPQQYKVTGTANDLTGEHVILNWSSTMARVTSNATADTALRSTEKIDFPKGMEALKEVKLIMKGKTADFIGIQYVRAIGAEEQIFMLVSGVVSASHEQCLQYTDRAVTLNDCISAIAYGDGREIWQLTGSGQLQSAQTEPAMCLHYQTVGKNGDDQPLYSVGLHSCNESESRFAYLPNGQLKASVEHQDLCVVALGPKPGFINLLEPHDQGAEASTTVDVEHDANNALSTKQTFWCSTAFPDCAEHNVYWQFDLGNGSSGGIVGDGVEGHLVERVEVDWEYPPLAYSILTSHDGISYQDAVYNPANPHNMTIDDLGSVRTRFIRISMHKPHPMLGQVAGSGKPANQLGSAVNSGNAKYAYGIKNVRVLQNRLTLGLKDCAKSANMNTVGDKWFMVAIRQYDAAGGKMLKDASNFTGGLKLVQDATANLYDIIPEMQTCAKKGQDLIERYQKNVREALPDFQKQITSLLDKPISAGSDVSLGSLTAGPIAGMSVELPLQHGCNPKQPPGFYYTSVPCSPARVLRLFCTNDGDGMWLYEGGRTVTRKSTLDVERGCAADGLKPASIKSLKQYDQIITMLAMRNVTFPDLGSNIPLAFDLSCDSAASGGCMEVYYDLGAFSDVTGILSQRQRPSTITGKIASGAALAITSLSKTTSIEEVDWYRSKQVGFLCGQKGGQSTGFVAKLDCATTMLSPIFQGGRNTFFVVSCPPNCVHAASRFPIYGGREGSYADLSSVCVAAIHRGIINMQSFTVGVESAQASYPSITSNGLTSRALATPTSFSFRITDVEDRCPASDLVMAVDENSARKLTAKPPTLVVPATDNAWDVGLDLGQKKAVQASLNPVAATLGAANNYTINRWYETEELIGRYMKVDGASTTYSRQTSMNALIEGRATIKPIETTISRFQAKNDNVYMDLHLNVKRTLSIVAAFLTKLQDTQQRVNLIAQQRNKRIKKLELTKSSKLEDFSILPEVSGGRTLWWSIGSSRKGDGATVLKATGSVSAADESLDFIDGQPWLFAPGSYVTHENIYFYDSTFSVDLVLTSAYEVAMVGWRVKKSNGDGYWLLLRQSDSVEATATPPPSAILAKLLLKKESKITVLSHWVYSIVNDVESFNVEIEVARGRQTVQIEGKTVIDQIDETYSTGHLAYGVYRKADASQSTEFHTVLAVPNCCQRPNRRGEQVEPPTCFRWSDTNPALSPSQLFAATDLTIEKKRNFHGRPVAFEAVHEAPRKNPLSWNKDEVMTPNLAFVSPTPAIRPIFFKPKGRPQQCSLGTFSSDIYLPPDCPDYEVGPMVGLSEKDFHWLSIDRNGVARSYKVNGTHDVTVMEETYLHDLSPAVWYSFTAYVNDNSFKLSLYNVTGKYQGAFATPFYHEGPLFLGLAARGCDHIPFARFKVAS